MVGKPGTGWGLTEDKQFLDGRPCTLREGISEIEASRLENALDDFQWLLLCSKPGRAYTKLTVLNLHIHAFGGKRPERLGSQDGLRFSIQDSSDSELDHTIGGHTTEQS